MKNQFNFESEPLEFLREFEDQEIDYFPSTPRFSSRRRARHPYQRAPFLPPPNSRFQNGFGTNYEVYQPADSEDVIQGFTGKEHRDIGNLALGQIPTSIVYNESGTQLTFGEMISLAGDYFETPYEINELARTRLGRAHLAFARWRALDLDVSQKPRISDQKLAEKIEKAVIERYHVLASQNISHFSAGGTGWGTYLKWHMAAIINALEAGHQSNDKKWRWAVAEEGFACHFLTDIFSSGHIRTPRDEMRSWYKQYFPDSIERIIRYMSGFIFDYLNKRNRLPVKARLFPGKARESIARDIKKLGGAAIDTFSLGDIVSLAIHNYDGNTGLEVVSEADVNGNRIQGGFRWRAVGDGCLKLESPSNPITTNMAVAAVKASFREFEAARNAGKNAAGRPLDQMAAIKGLLGTPYSFAAKVFVPREDLASRSNVRLPGAGAGAAPLEWRWGKLGSEAYKQVDITVRGEIADRLKDQLPKVDKKQRDAFEAFIKLLTSKGGGILTLQKAVGRNAQ